MTDIHPPLKGGCLCSSVRYTITFPPGSKYPPEPNTCQCSQCRKQTGALVAHWITVAPSSVTWSSSQPKEYNSSPGCYRSFCADCGTAINWRTDKSPDMIQFLVGSLDEDVLSGVGGKELATPTKGQFFCKNMIGGVTDHIGDEVGKIWEGSPA